MAERTAPRPLLTCAARTETLQVLEVERTATDDEIKKSYRLLARKWHPDKNPHQAEVAHAKFQEIQNAYDVLSEPNERAWYDEHRVQILRGGAGAGDVEGDLVDLYAYFGASCFKGYGDDSKSFYAVYGSVFEALLEEERDFSDGSRPVPEMPAFGSAATPLPEVAAFYAAWQSFSTLKTFAWVDEWDVRQAPNRLDQTIPSQGRCLCMSCHRPTIRMAGLLQKW